MRNTKGESTDGHDGGGSSGSSDEALVTSGERSGSPSSKMVVANRAIGRSDRFQRRLSSQDGREMGDEPCKSRGLRTVLWAAGGEIPPADPAAWNPNKLSVMAGSWCTAGVASGFIADFNQVAIWIAQVDGSDRPSSAGARHRPFFYRNVMRGEVFLHVGERDIGDQAEIRAAGGR